MAPVESEVEEAGFYRLVVVRGRTKTWSMMFQGCRTESACSLNDSSASAGARKQAQCDRLVGHWIVLSDQARREWVAQGGIIAVSERGHVLCRCSIGQINEECSTIVLA